MKNNLFKRIISAMLCIAALLCLCACGGGNEVETATPAPVETPTAAPTPTATPEPTATPVPTSTPEPTQEPSPEVTPEPTTAPTPKPTKKPSTPQLNLSENAEKNVNINQQDTNSNNDSPIPGLAVGEGGPYAGSNGNGVTDDRSRDLTDEQVWDPARKIYTYLEKGDNNAQNVPGAGEPKKWDYEPVDVHIDQTGQEA